MKKYRRLQSALVALVLGTFALGMVSAVRPAGEIFPFASWFLFSLVPQQVTSYELRVLEWKHQKFDPPKSIIEVDGLVRNPRSSTVYQLIQRYGAGNDPERGQTLGAEAAWELLRARFTSTDHLCVQTFRVTYDPIERWRTGCVIQAQELGLRWLDTSSDQEGGDETPAADPKP